MKKLLALLLALTMVFAFAACGQTAAPQPLRLPPLRAATLLPRPLLPMPSF